MIADIAIRATISCANQSVPRQAGRSAMAARTAVPSWWSISPGSGSPFIRTARPLFGKAMAPVKVGGRHRVKCTTSPSRPRKPTPPNGRLPPPSGNRSVSSSIGAAGRPPRSHCPHTACPRARRRPPWLPSGRYDPYSTAVPLLWSPPGSGHSGSGPGST